MVADLVEQLEDLEVRAALQMLSSRGLGITVLHQHDETSDTMTALREDVVQFEDDLRVSFLLADSPALEGSTAVTAAWRNGPVVVGRCRQGHTQPPPPPHS